MKRYILIMAFAGLLSLLIGCSGFDTTLLLVHPDTTVVSGTFDVVLTNVYLYLDTGSTVSKKVERDSLHLLVGLPESWEIAKARMTVVSDMGTEQMLELQSGAMDDQALVQLAQKYIAQAVELSSDAGLPKALSGKTITAHGSTGDEDMTVNVDDVKQWKGFSAPVNIVFAKGSKPDSVFFYDSAITFASRNGIIADSQVTTITELKTDRYLKNYIPDTLGINVVPIAIFLTIKAGDKEGVEKLYYFSKTDSMNPKPSWIVSSVPGMSDIEAGDMTYASIEVVNAARVKSERRPFSASTVMAIADRSTGTVRIDLGRLNPKRASIGIYSLEGNLVRSLTPAGYANSVVWNGADERGSRVGSGTYLIRVDGNGGSVVRSVQMVR